MAKSEEEKKLLRKSMRLLRAEKRGGDEIVAKNFLALPEIKDEKTFFVYCSFGTEADTMPVINELLAKGKTVFLPRVENTDMVAVQYEKGTPLAKGRYGIKEPVGPAYDGTTDVTVLPLLAIDKKGNRLGYGGGYYDRFLEKKDTLKIAYCYDFQVLEEVCAAAHDIKADLIVTDKRIIRIKEEKL